MPLYTFIDDVIYDGPGETFDKLVFYASFFAIYVLNIEADIRSYPPHFYPRDTNPEIIQEFIECYRLAFDSLLLYIDVDGLTPLE